MMNDKEYEIFDSYFHPKTIAIVGATDNPFSGGSGFLLGLISAKFPKIFPINKNKSANQTLTGDTVVVGNAPIFITFQTTNISNPITLHIKESGIAITLYVIIFIVLISSLGLTVLVIKRRKIE